VLDEIRTIIAVNRAWNDFAAANRKAPVNEDPTAFFDLDTYGIGVNYLEVCFEDELTSRLILQDLLSKYGDCHVAVNGFEAVAAFRSALQSRKGYDLICMDVRMPVMDGTEAVQQIRSIEEHTGILLSNAVKIFMTTSIQDIKTVATSFKALCDTYLIKPVEGARLNEHMRAFGLLDHQED
jgi:two-component system chemotaxis response regulator CheY